MLQLSSEGATSCTRSRAEGNIWACCSGGVQVTRAECAMDCCSLQGFWHHQNADAKWGILYSCKFAFIGRGFIFTCPHRFHFYSCQFLSRFVPIPPFTLSFQLIRIYSHKSSFYLIFSLLYSSSLTEYGSHSALVKNCVNLVGCG